MKKKIKTRRAAPVKPPAAKPPRLMKVVSREPYGRRALIALAAEIFSERGYEAASHDGMKDPLAESIEAIIARSEAIAALAMDADKPLSSAFSKKENVNTTDISIAFMTAIAGTASIEDVRALKPEIERMRDKVLATSEAVADRIRDNPLMLSRFVNGLQTLFRLLLDADPTIRVVAGFASEHKGVVRSVFMAFLTDLRHQLESSEGTRQGRLAQGAESLVNGLGTLLSRSMTSTLERYAETTRKEMRSTKKELLRAYQSGGESVETLSGPRSEEKREQVRKVILHIASSRTPVSIADACNASFRYVEGGYSSAHELYVWCHRNEAKILRMVDELRLV